MKIKVYSDQQAHRLQVRQAKHISNIILVLFWVAVIGLVIYEIALLSQLS